MLQLAKYVRKPFDVNAVKVTADNFEEVAQWCGGEIEESEGFEGRGVQRFIRVPVKRPLSDRQTCAYVGDWVLSALRGPAGFKVYTPKAFNSSFDPDRMFETLDRMEKRAQDEERAEDEDQLEIGDFAQAQRR
jgi:hypothetical protein